MRAVVRRQTVDVLGVPVPVRTWQEDLALLRLLYPDQPSQCQTCRRYWCPHHAAWGYHHEACGACQRRDEWEEITACQPCRRQRFQRWLVETGRVRS